VWCEPEWAAPPLRARAGCVAARWGASLREAVRLFSGTFCLSVAIGQGMLCKNPLRGHAQAVERLLTASWARELWGQFRLSRTPVSPHLVDSPVQVSGRTVVQLPYPSDAGCQVQ